MSRVTSAEPVLPGTLKRTVLVAVLAAIAGLALHQPLLVGAALTGLFVGVGLVGLSATPGRVAVAAMLLPLSLVAAVTAIGALGAGFTLSTVLEVSVDGSVSAAGAALTATVLGIALVGTVAGGVDSESVSRASVCALAGAGFGTVLVLVGAALAEVEGAATPLEGALFVAGDGASGLAGSVVVAAVALVVAIVGVPNAAVTAPDRRKFLTSVRTGLTAIVLVVGGALVALVAMLQFVLPSQFAPLVFDNRPLRGVLVALAGLGFGVAGWSLLVRLSWERTDSDDNPDAALLLGTALSVTAIVGTGFALGVSPNVIFLVPVLLFLAGGGLWGLQGLIGTFGGRVADRGTVHALLAVLCLAGAVAVAGDVGGATTLDRSGLGATVALGAGLVVYSVGRYGATLADEVGTAGAGRTPQLVHVAYAGTVVTVGTVLALAGFVAAMAVAPTLPVSATVGIVTALLGTVLVLRYFLR